MNGMAGSAQAPSVACLVNTAPNRLHHQKKSPKERLLRTANRRRDQRQQSVKWCSLLGLLRHSPQAAS